MTREILFSKCYQVIACRCDEGKITEEQAESEWDKLELMNADQLKRYLKRVKQNA